MRSLDGTPSLTGPAIVMLFLLSLPAVTPRIYASDEIQYFAFLRSLWFDRDVSFENEYRYFYDAGIARTPGFHETFLGLTSDTGLRISFATIGSALLWTPFYAIADLSVIVARSLGATVPRDGFSWPYVAAVCYGSVLYGFLGLVLSVKAATMLGITEARSRLAALVVWIGTPLLFYTHLAPAMAHANSAFCVAAFIVIWLHVRRTWSIAGCLALGAAGALMVMVREQDVTFVVIPAIDLLYRVVRDPRFGIKDTIAPALAGAVSFGAVFWPQALAYLTLNGHVGPPRVVGRKMYWTSPHALEILLSPEHGFFFWTPLAVVGLAGLWLVVRRLWRGERSIEAPAVNLPEPRAVAFALVATFVLQVYLLGSLDSWTSAGAFGQRRFVGSTVLFVIGLGGLFALLRTSKLTAIGTAIAGVCIWWNLALMAEFGTGLMDRQRLELKKNAYDAFVTVPAMAPHLAYRYLFDRASFYRSPGTTP